MRSSKGYRSICCHITTSVCLHNTKACKLVLRLYESHHSRIIPNNKRERFSRHSLRASKPDQKTRAVRRRCHRRTLNRLVPAPTPPNERCKACRALFARRSRSDARGTERLPVRSRDRGRGGARRQGRRRRSGDAWTGEEKSQDISLLPETPTSGQMTRPRGASRTWSSRCRGLLRPCKVLLRLSCSAAELSRGSVRSIIRSKVLRLSARRRQRRRRHELTIILLVVVGAPSSKAVVVFGRRKAVIWLVVIPVLLLLLHLIFLCTLRRRHVVVERTLCLGDAASSGRRSNVFWRRRQSRRAGGRPVGRSRRVVSKSTVRSGRANLCQSQVKGSHVLLAREGYGAHARRSFELSSACRDAGPPCREVLPFVDVKGVDTGGGAARFCIEL